MQRNYKGVIIMEETKTVPVYVDSQRIADLTSIPETGIRRLAREHKIPAIKIGGTWRFNEAKVLRYVEKKYSNDYFEV